LPDAAYDAIATNLTDYPGVTLTNDELDASVTVDLSATMGRVQVRVLGDLTIPPGVTLTFVGNVELWVRGFLTVNGTIRVTGGQAAGNAGYLGSTYGGRAKLIGAPGDPQVQAPGAQRVQGENQQLPPLEVVNEAGTLLGIPSSMAGSGGGEGGGVLRFTDGFWESVAVGGAGGQGGGSIVTVTRGLGFGGAGSINTSGQDGSIGQSFGADNAGSGGGGAPGCVLIMIDGVASAYPILSSGKIVAEYGISPANGADETVRGKAAETLDLANAVAQVLFVPVSRSPYPEAWLLDSGSATQGPPGVGYFVTYNESPRDTPPAMPTGDGNQNGWSTTLTADANWVSYKQAVSILSGDWSIVRLLESPGVDGSTPLFLYQRSTTQPLTPAGDNPGLPWTDNPAVAATQAGTGPIWVSTNRRLGDGMVDGPWTSPVQWNGLDGLNGTDGNTPVFYYIRALTAPPAPTGNPPGGGWEADPSATSGSNPIFVTSNALNGQGQLVGPYSNPVRWSGEDGQNGTDGNTPIFLYRRAVNRPATPSGLTPPGWAADPDDLAGDEQIWVSQNALNGQGQLVGLYTVPVRWNGQDGANAVTAMIDRGNIIVTDNNGTIDYAGAFAQWSISDGQDDVTNQGTYSFTPLPGLSANLTQDGLFEVLGVTNTVTNVPLQAQYNGRTFDTTVTIRVEPSAAAASLAIQGGNVNVIGAPIGAATQVATRTIANATNPTVTITGAGLSVQVTGGVNVAIFSAGGNGTENFGTLRAEENGEIDEISVFVQHGTPT
ncbi:MAG: hypothetical protein AAF552_10860, partial [Pseudomonadota bacterium]